MWNNNVDPNGPCPMEYYAARQWQAMRDGKPPKPAMGIPYEMPTEYYARQAYLKKYADAREKFLNGRQNPI